MTVPSAAPPRLPQGPFIIPADFNTDRERVFAAPGDFALANRHVTLVVRKRDGWLVDFWRQEATPATSGALAGHSRIDGLWQLHPVLQSGGAQVSVTTGKVSHEGDSIRTETSVSLGAGRVRVITRYRLDEDAPRALITTRFEHLAGGRLAHLSLGDAVKWGNTDYFVDGARQKPTYSGKGHWVGRQGAGGDLMLRTGEPTPMGIGFRSYHNGLSGEVRTVYRTVSIEVGGSAEITRELSYGSIATPESIARTGVLKVTLRDEHGAGLASKLSLSGLLGTLTPHFGNSGGLSGAGRFVWSGTGDFSRRLAPGRYQVWATAGFERDAKSWQVDIRADQTTTLEAQLPRVVSTPGWVSADLHLHQAPSVDADISNAARVISVAAEGVELAGATDHYVVADLGPTIRELERSGRLTTRVLSMMGSEISTVGHLFGHFNLLPMEPGQNVNYTDTTPKQLFAEMRQVAPKGLIQVNHPRMDSIGYFARYRLDPATMRVPAQHQAEYSDDFDLLEVFNGLEMMSQPKLRKGLGDWLKLLGRGHRYAATGNSDSHGLFYLDPGLPRNFIRVPRSTSDTDDLSVTQEEVIDSLRRGRVVVTSGPMLEVSVDGHGPGDTVKLASKQAALRIRVQAAPWIDVTQIEVLLGPEGRRVRFIPVTERGKVVRYDQTIDLAVSASTFVVVLVTGTKALPHTHTPGTRPIAFSNPIWLEPG